MPDTEIIKLIIQGGFAGLAAALVALLAYALRHMFTQGDQQAKQDQIWMAMFEKVLSSVLDGQQAKFKELAEDFNTSLGKTVIQIQHSHATDIERLIERIDNRMTGVTDERKKFLTNMQTTLKTVPTETQRVLQPDIIAQTESIRLAFETALSNMEARLMNQLNGDNGNARQVVQNELTAMRSNLSAMLERIAEIQQVLETLKPREQATEPGESASPVPEKTENKPKEGEINGTA